MGSTERPRSLIAATVHHLAEPVGREILAFFGDRVDPLLAQAGGPPLAVLQTEPAPNTFRALPVREGEHVLVRVARFDDVDHHAAHLERLARSPAWHEVQRDLQRRLRAPSQHLRLRPTGRSLLR